MTYQLLGAVAIVVGLVGTWFAARSRGGWLLCIASTVLWLPALTTGGQWTAVGNCALSIGICLRNFLVHPARTRRPGGQAPRQGPAKTGPSCLKAWRPRTGPWVHRRTLRERCRP